MINLIQTAMDQGWTIGELNKRISEQSSLNNIPKFRRRLDRGGKADRIGNKLNTYTGYSNDPKTNQALSCIDSAFNNPKLKLGGLK